MHGVSNAISRKSNLRNLLPNSGWIGERRERYIVEVPPESWMGRRMPMLFCINARSKEKRELEARESWLGKKLRRKSFFPEFPA